MPDLPRYYRILGPVEEDILFEVKASQDIPEKSVNLASVVDVRGLTYVSFPAFKFKSPELGREVASHDAQDAGAPTLEISIAVS
jgi:hypothetical protein